MKEYQKNTILTRERLGIICCSPEEKKRKKRRRRRFWGRVRSACCWLIYLFICFAVGEEAKLCRSFCRRSGTNALLEAEDWLQTDSCSAPPLGALGRLAHIWCRCQSWSSLEKEKKTEERHSTVVPYSGWWINRFVFFLLRVFLMVKQSGLCPQLPFSCVFTAQIKRQ